MLLSQISGELLKRYTLDGKVRIIACQNNLQTYMCLKNKDKEYMFPSSGIRKYSKEIVDLFFRLAARRQSGYYITTDSYLYAALNKYFTAGEQVAVMGTQTPFYECICLSYGGYPTAIDYNVVECQDGRIRYKTTAQQKYDGERFDSAFSISSFEHDGLGRFGDPLNPDGDLMAMNEMRYIIKPKGKMYLSIPVGIDTIMWDAHRVYGKIRLPMLLEKWNIVETFGFNAQQLTEDTWTGRNNKDYQPVFVLENTFPLESMPER
jgi:hypothetical protein